jgi:hypothetical protein
MSTKDLLKKIMDDTMSMSSTTDVGRQNVRYFLSKVRCLVVERQFPDSLDFTAEVFVNVHFLAQEGEAALSRNCFIFATYLNTLPGTHSMYMTTDPFAG